MRERQAKYPRGKNQLASDADIGEIRSVEFANFPGPSRIYARCPAAARLRGFVFLGGALVGGLLASWRQCCRKDLLKHRIEAVELPIALDLLELLNELAGESDREQPMAGSTGCCTSLPH